MKRVDMKDIVDCLEYIQNKQNRQDDRMNIILNKLNYIITQQERNNIILDKLNYIITQQERNRNECKKKLNAIYGYKPAHFLTSAEIYKYIPFAEFDLSINSEIVKRQCTWEEFFEMKDGLYNEPLNTRIDLKKALNHVVSIDIPSCRKTHVNLIAIIEGEF